MSLVENMQNAFENGESYIGVFTDLLKETLGGYDFRGVPNDFIRI